MAYNKAKAEKEWLRWKEVGISVLALALNGLVVLGVDGLYHRDHILGRYLLGKPELSQLFCHGSTPSPLDFAQSGW